MLAVASGRRYSTITVPPSSLSIRRRPGGVAKAHRTAIDAQHLADAFAVQPGVGVKLAEETVEQGSPRGRRLLVLPDGLAGVACLSQQAGRGRRAERRREPHRLRTAALRRFVPPRRLAIESGRPWRERPRESRDRPRLLVLTGADHAHRRAPPPRASALRRSASAALDAGNGVAAMLGHHKAERWYRPSGARSFSKACRSRASRRRLTMVRHGRRHPARRWSASLQADRDQPGENPDALERGSVERGHVIDDFADRVGGNRAGPARVKASCMGQRRLGGGTAPA